MSVRAGFMTLKEAIARNGYDPSDVLVEISETNARLDELDLVLDSDPRKATQTGAAQSDAAQASSAQAGGDKEPPDDEHSDEEDDDED